MFWVICERNGCNCTIVTIGDLSKAINIMIIMIIIIIIIIIIIKPFKGDEDDEIGLASDNSCGERVEQLWEKQSIELPGVREWPFKHCK